MSSVLRVCPQNPRYVTSDGRRAIYLAGSHTWNNLVDMGRDFPPLPFDFAAYLDFLARYNHNFFRLWAWELPRAACPRYPFRKRMQPFPWERTGPGDDVSGLPRFGLSRFSQGYFDRLRERVVEAGRRGFWVSVMLFEGWSAQQVPDMTPHPFFHANNVNDVSYAEDPRSINMLANPRILAFQEAYVVKVIETVNDLDNVFYEIVNEAGGYSTEWQYHMIRFVHDREARLPKQHLVGMTFQWSGGSNRTLEQSEADWISPGEGANREYGDDPPAGDGRKVIVSDTDHLGGSGTGDRVWVWKSFARGLHTLFMDRYEPPWSVTDKPYEKAEEIRRAMGHTVLFSRRMDLAHAVPRPELASTRYCLASPGREYLVYLPQGGIVELDLSGHQGSLRAEWFDPETGQSFALPIVSGGGKRSFSSPLPHDTVLYLSTPRA